jgi:hypothetical protein
LQAKQSEVSELETKKRMYEIELKKYREFQSEINTQKDIVADCESKVSEIFEEIKSIIESANLPDDFSIDLTNKNDILFRTHPTSEYLPITNETLASSAIFIAAFKLQANYLNEFRVAHFDVSYLDYENRKKVLDEAIKMNIQLITESPAYTESEKELQYVITE